MLNRDIRIRNPPKAAIDRMLASPVTRSALERAKADMAAAASKVSTAPLDLVTQRGDDFYRFFAACRHHVL